MRECDQGNVMSGAKGDAAAVLSPAEAAEVDRICAQDSVIGYCLIDDGGRELEADGAWRDALPPVLFNLMSIADQVAAELGEEGPCPVVFIESDGKELAGLTLSTSRAMFVSKKAHKLSKGIGRVSTFGS